MAAVLELVEVQLRKKSCRAWRVMIGLSFFASI
jgi:hypothetical protein